MTKVGLGLGASMICRPASSQHTWLYLRWGWEVKQQEVLGQDSDQVSPGQLFP